MHPSSQSRRTVWGALAHWWSGRRTYLAEVERERDRLRAEVTGLRAQVDAIQSARLLDQQRFVDTIGTSFGTGPVHAPPPPEPPSPIERGAVDGVEDEIERERRARKARRAAYALSHDLTYEEVVDLERRGALDHIHAAAVREAPVN